MGHAQALRSMGRADAAELGNLLHRAINALSQHAATLIDGLEECHGNECDELIDAEFQALALPLAIGPYLNSPPSDHDLGLHYYLHPRHLALAISIRVREIISETKRYAITIKKMVVDEICRVDMV